jgi:hypothetical protein
VQNRKEGAEVKAKRKRPDYGEFTRIVREAERELESVERLWRLGVIAWRDQKQYQEEIEPFSFDQPLQINVLRVIR